MGRRPRRRSAKRTSRPAASSASGGWGSLLEELRRFRDARDWKQFHNPKDLAAALAIEAGELQERFLWRTPAEVALDLKDRVKRRGTVEELADVFICALLLSDILEVDVDHAVRAKLRVNGRKYPVHTSRGTSRKYSELDQA